MKKIAIVMLIGVILIACSGDDGVDGIDGVNITGQIIEIEGSFTANNNYGISFAFPNTVEVLESDVVLIYLLYDQKPDNNAIASDVWRLLPQTVILDQGLLQYNYEHTFFDVDIFLDGDFDLSTLLAGDTENQVFRIAILPADSLGDASLNANDFNAVLEKLSVSEREIERVQKIN